MKSLAIVALVLALAPAAHADGIFVWRLQDQDIREPQQKAFIIHDQGWEDLVLSVKYEGAPQEFGWIVPLPAKPQMEAVDGAIFESLSKATQAPHFEVTIIPGGGLMAGDTMERPTVTTERIGIYDVSVLEGGNIDGLRTWLETNAFVMPSGADPILAAYLNRGWVFAAMRIAPPEWTDEVADSLAAGSTQPVHFRFPAAGPVFPLRISSLAGQESEVLLYVLSRQGWVPESAPGMAWEFNCWAKDYWFWFGDLHGIGTGSPFLVRTRDRFAANADSLILTKARAVVRPANMQDVTFKPFPFWERIFSNVLSHRAEAGSYMGQFSPPGSAAILDRFLGQASAPKDPHGRLAAKAQVVDSDSSALDVRAALRALGKVGGLDNVPTLVRWAASDNEYCQYEAIFALEAIHPAAATRICLEEFVRRLPQAKEDALVPLCSTHLVAFGGSECLPELTRLIKKHYDPRSWDDGWLWKQRSRIVKQGGQTALLIAAACGDDSSRAELARILRQAAVFCSLQWNRENNARSPGANYNDYPEAMLPGMAIIHGEIRNGLVVERMTADLARRPAVRDSLFRSVALDTTRGAEIPDDFRAILLAKTAALEPADERMLLDIWDRAWVDRDRQDESIIAADLAGAATMEWAGRAVAAVYALGAQKRCAALDRLWAATDWREPVIKSEIAMAATLTKDPAAVPLIVSYVKHRWSATAQDPKFLARAEAVQDHPWGWPHGVPLDEGHRAGEIERFLGQFGQAEARALAADPDIPPLLRLYFCFNPWSVWVGHYEERRQDFVALAREFPTGNLRVRIDNGIQGAEKLAGLGMEEKPRP